MIRVTRARVTPADEDDVGGDALLAVRKAASTPASMQVASCSSVYSHVAAYPSRTHPTIHHICLDGRSVMCICWDTNSG